MSSYDARATTRPWKSCKTKREREGRFRKKTKGESVKRACVCVRVCVRLALSEVPLLFQWHPPATPFSVRLLLPMPTFLFFKYTRTHEQQQQQPPLLHQQRQCRLFLIHAKGQWEEEKGYNAIAAKPYTTILYFLCIAKLRLNSTHSAILLKSGSSLFRLRSRVWGFQFQNI